MFQNMAARAPGQQNLIKPASGTSWSRGGEAANKPVHTGEAFHESMGEGLQHFVQFGQRQMGVIQGK